MRAAFEARKRRGVIINDEKPKPSHPRGADRPIIGRRHSSSAKLFVPSAR